MKKYFILYMLISILIVSCDDFLSKRPSKASDIVPTTYDDMQTILIGMWREDCVSFNLVYGNDDIDLNAQLEKSLPGSYSLQAIEGATWERVKNGTNKDYLWLYRHQNIFKSNMVLNMIDKIKDITDNDRQRLRSDACFRRAFSYMELLNIYTLPYCNENLDEYGLVKCETASFNYSLKRMSLKDTYDFIEKDIMEALKIDVDLVARTGKGSPYWVTTAVANALASRFYMMKHDYENAKKYAKASLNLYGEDKIIDYNSIGYSSKVDKGSITINDSTINFEVKYPNTYVGYNTTDWTEHLFIGYAEGSFSSGFSVEKMISQSLEDCFDADGDKEMDTRWRYFYVKNFCYLNGKPIDRPYDMRVNEYTITVPEMLLTVAECEARLGNISEAMKYVNILRAKRIDPKGIVTLSASTQDDAIAKILRERRREMGPSKRLFDIRRYNSNEYEGDDVIVRKRFFKYNESTVDYNSELIEYTLSPKDRKIASQIPESDILSSRGVLQQNRC